MGYLIAALMSYLIGCSNMALYISKIKKVDITSKGSSNLGASNATILLGWRAGVLVGAHDIGKAALAVLLAKHFFPDLQAVEAVAGVACVLGHMFPFYLGFKGGKGFASYLGMTIALNWKFALVILLGVVLVTVISDYIVMGTMLTILTVPVGMAVINKSVVIGLILAVATAVILYKHRENLVRIVKGTEIGLRSAIKGENKIK